MGSFVLGPKALKLSTREDVQEYLDAIESSEPLTHFSISGNSLGVEAAQAFAQLLARQNSLTV